jgi:flagellar biosynthesis/type III secretory pathway chaperone
MQCCVSNAASVSNVTAGSESELLDILGCSIFHATSLRDALQAEHHALVEQDIDALLRAIEEKGASVQELQTLDQRRDALCAAFGAVSGPEQMNAFLSSSLNPAEIESAWTKLLSLADECSLLNKANGAIIRVRKHHIEDGLALIRGSEPGNTTYARDGKNRDGLGNRAIAEC